TPIWLLSLSLSLFSLSLSLVLSRSSFWPYPLSAGPLRCPQVAPPIPQSRSPVERREQRKASLCCPLFRHGAHGSRRQRCRGGGAQGEGAKEAEEQGEEGVSDGAGARPRPCVRCSLSLLFPLVLLLVLLLLLLF